MAVTLPSFAKINIGLAIGPRRADGFHELRTLYQTIALHDQVRVEVQRGAGIEIRCRDPRVPTDESNTCWRMAERALRRMKARGRVVITLEKRLPVAGGVGAASSNAVATLLALERALRSPLPPEERLALAAEVGSDLPLFLLGGAVLGTGRGEEVFPLPDLPRLYVVLATPELMVSTPEAFADWDRQARKLTAPGPSDTIKEFSRSLFAGLSRTSTGVPTVGRGNRAEALLLDLVRTGIENDFERVVFPRYPELRDLKRALYGNDGQRARYCSLSGSGASLYGLYPSRSAAEQAARAAARLGAKAVLTSTLSRPQYWRQLCH